MIYGFQTAVDARVIESVLGVYSNRPCRFLEIGIHIGNTSRGIRDFMNAQGSALNYTGIDANPEVQSPFPEAKLITGDSALVFRDAPNKLDIVLIDGCHCINHVVLDTLHYGRRVVPGGFMMYHDIAPQIQQTMKDPHGPNIPEFHNSVLAAFELMQWPHAGWTLWASDYDPLSHFGGISVYRKQS